MRKTSLFILFTISANHFMQRPLRDTMAVYCGSENLNWLMTGTLLGTLGLSLLFLEAERRQSLQKLLPALLIIIASIQLWLYLALQDLTFNVAFFYFVLTGSTSLSLISLLWRRVLLAEGAGFQPVSIGYTASNFGALAGPIATLVVSYAFDSFYILPLSSLLLVTTAFLTSRLKLPGVNETNPSPSFRFPLKRVSLFVLLYTVVSTCFYFLLLQTVSLRLDHESGIWIFTTLDITINTVVIALPMFLSERFVKPMSFLLVPCLSLLLMIWLGFDLNMITAALAVFLFKVGNLCLQRPAREFLYTRSSFQAPYSTKNFIDASIYRFGDALGSWFIFLILSSGLQPHHVALLLVPFIIMWIITGHSISKSVNLIS